MDNRLQSYKNRGIFPVKPLCAKYKFIVCMKSASGDACTPVLPKHYLIFFVLLSWQNRKTDSNEFSGASLPFRKRS